jgi:hypothetical protein
MALPHAGSKAEHRGVLQRVHAKKVAVDPGGTAKLV